MLCEVYRKSEYMYLLVWFSSKLSANLKCMIKHEMFSLLSKCYHKFNLYVYFHCKEAGYYMYLHCLGRLQSDNGWCQNVQYKNIIYRLIVLRLLKFVRLELNILRYHRRQLNSKQSSYLHNSIKEDIQNFGYFV